MEHLQAADKGQTIACVTGATGMVGARIVQRLAAEGYRIRALSRREHTSGPLIDFFRGGLEEEDVLESFLHGAHLLFHCAAELKDRARMWEVNVTGTERLLHVAAASGIQYLCHLSSAGVVGKTNLPWVDESSACHPQNEYEHSKWAAEELVARSVGRCRVVILRPTNVIDDARPGALDLPIRGAWLDRLKIFIKGGECAHIVHAEDVAAAAMHFLSVPSGGFQRFFVSCDDDPLNTLAGLEALVRAYKAGIDVENLRPKKCAPVIIPHLMRRLAHGKGNRGDVRYSSRRLLSAGFVFPLGLRGAVKRVVSTRVCR